MRFRQLVEQESGAAPASPHRAATSGAALGGNQMMVRLLSGGEHAPAGADLAKRIAGRLGRGQPLPGEVRTDMETSLGHDFGPVMIHRDAEADSLAGRLGARAFTTGQDVFFASGAYNPDSSEGRATLAHELVHTVQQPGPVAGTETAPGLSVSDPHDRDEQEAATIARRLPERGVLGPPDALRLQRSAGNAAVTRLLRVQRDPAIHAGDGTTQDLQNELTRLRTEQAQQPEGSLEKFLYYKPIERVELLLHERADTGKPFSDISLSFDGRTLSMFAPTSVSFAAVSGRPTAAGTFDYSRDRQRQENEGPIPAGTYWLDPDEMTNLRFHLFTSSASWGTHRITIHPAPDTATYGRGGFFIHGGSSPGSIGCIDLTSRMAAFAEALANNVRSGSRVRLVVSYPEPAPDTAPDNSTRAA